MRTYVRVSCSGIDPARRRRRVLRLGRAAGRSEAPGKADHRRRRRCHGGELRGARLRDPWRDGRRTGQAPLSPRGVRAAALLRLHGGEQGALRPVRSDRAAGRGHVAGGGVSRRPRAREDLRDPARDRRAAAVPGAGAGRAGGHRRRRPDEGARQDGEPGSQARWPVGDRTRAGAGLSRAAACRGPLGCRRGDRGAAPRPRDRHDRAARASRRGGARHVPGRPRRAASPRGRAQPRSTARPSRPAAAVDRHAVGVRRRREIGIEPRRAPGDPGGPGDAAGAGGEPGGPHGDAAVALRRLLPGDPLPHPRPPERRHGHDPGGGEGPAHRRRAPDRAPRDHPARDHRRQPQRPGPAGAPS